MQAKQPVPHKLEQLLLRTCPSSQKLDDLEDAYEANRQTLGKGWQEVPKNELYLLAWLEDASDADDSNAGKQSKKKTGREWFAWLTGYNADTVALVEKLAVKERDRQTAIRSMPASEQARRTPLFMAFLWLEGEMRKLKLRNSLIDDVYRTRLGPAGIVGVSEQRAWELVTSLRNGYVQMFLEVYAYAHEENSDEFRSIARAVHDRFADKTDALYPREPSNACCTQCRSGTQCGSKKRAREDGVEGKLEPPTPNKRAKLVV
jgi:hypothetical protein